MKTQVILACDDKGKFLEYIPKEAGHTGDGRKHLGISVLVYNHKGQVLLQRRKHKVFDNIWDLTGATHPLHKKDGTDESLEEATLRCLKREYDIENIKLKNLGAFNYFAKIDNICENEHCFMMIGEYNGPVSLDTEVGYEYKWVYKEEFLIDIKKNPNKYSAWAKEGVYILTASGFFDKV
ncbi:MAG: Uncharacterized protein G01um10147_312 [Microgenomates group bacterium Gr01-1014_7]|nr:MAG: Uncharacterized protein G01um10147_312 [Microgenomates group bacterium Gr01-1014_7]